MSGDPSHLSPPQIAEAAGLRYVGDHEPGLTRRRCGQGFTYLDAQGRRIRSAPVLRRIEQLAIPPAWQDVWICSQDGGHLQATGRDQRGRKQYLYHPQWQEAAATTKFDRLLIFGRSLAQLRRRVAACAQQRRLSEQRTAAVILLLMDHTAIRVGNEEYVRQNGSYGLTTLRHKHLRDDRSTVRLRFTAKGGTRREVEIQQPQLVALLQQYYRLSGRHLFQYQSPLGDLRPIHADQVNEALRKLARLDITAKDFRTWKASAVVAGQLFDHCRCGRPPTRRVVAAAIADAAALLGNTKTICRNSYIHPRLLDSFASGHFGDVCSKLRPRQSKWMSRSERILLHFLEATEEAHAAKPHSSGTPLA